MSFSNGQAGLPRAGSLASVTDAFGNTFTNVANLTIQGVSGINSTPNTTVGGGTTNLTLFGAPDFLTSVTLTSAQIAAASGTPVTIVPAQGANTVVAVVNSWYTNVPGSSGWVSGVGGLFYNTSGTAADAGDKDVFRSLSGALTFSGPLSNVSGVLTNYANLPLVYATTAAYINGNGTGIINVLWNLITV